MLKKARSKSKLPDTKVGLKRRLDATLADETSKSMNSHKVFSSPEPKAPGELIV